MKYAIYWIHKDKLVRIITEGLDEAYVLALEKYPQKIELVKYAGGRGRRLSENLNPVFEGPIVVCNQLFRELVESFKMNINDNLYVEADGISFLTIMRIA
jgi:hypothetical protein